MKYISRYICGGLMAISGLSVYGWGQKGHDTVAYIAECHLSTEAKAAIDSLLDGKSIVDWSNWLDNASHTPEYAYSKTWHYRNIDEDETFETSRRNPKGDIITAITVQTSILADTTQSKDSRVLALKMVVHLLGDLHQPMHLGRASDLGGNRVPVRFFKSPKNLHSVWDSNILEAGHKWSYTEWKQQIDRASDREISQILSSDSPTDWARETYEIAQEIYATTPEDTNIEYNYIAKWTPVIEQQLLKGGLRLAYILNNAFTTNDTKQIKKAETE